MEDITSTNLLHYLGKITNILSFSKFYVLFVSEKAELYLVRIYLAIHMSYNNELFFELYPKSWTIGGGVFFMKYTL